MYPKTISFLIVSALSVSLGILAGFYLFSSDDTSSEDSAKRLDSTQYQFINPILDEEDSIAKLKNRDIRELKEAIESVTDASIEKHVITQGSVYVRDLNNGPWLLTGSEYSYRPASLFKIPLMIAVFKEAEKDPSLLEKTITYEKAFSNLPEHNVESSSETISVGNTYTVKELVERMIIFSDNAAAYLLLTIIDEEVVKVVFHDLDVPIEGVETTTTPFGPQLYASFFRVLYNGTYLSNDYSEMALEITSRSTFSHGIRSALPAGTKAGLKYGIAAEFNGQKQLHECGILYLDTQPYILCVMTMGYEYETMAEYIKEVTGVVYESISKESQSPR